MIEVLALMAGAGWRWMKGKGDWNGDGGKDWFETKLFMLFVGSGLAFIILTIALTPVGWTQLAALAAMSIITGLNLHMGPSKFIGGWENWGMVYRYVPLTCVVMGIGQFFFPLTFLPVIGIIIGTSLAGLLYPIGERWPHLYPKWIQPTEVTELGVGAAVIGALIFL
jgi:hypothetical protein